MTAELFLSIAGWTMLADYLAILFLRFQWGGRGGGGQLGGILLI